LLPVCFEARDCLLSGRLVLLSEQPELIRKERQMNSIEVLPE
jgi:hypothetical protein